MTAVRGSDAAAPSADRRGGPVADTGRLRADPARASATDVDALGTEGRLRAAADLDRPPTRAQVALLDAAECVPTFGIAPGQVRVAIDGATR